MRPEAQRIAIAEFCGLLKRPPGQIVEYQRWDEQAQGVFQRVKFPDRTSPCYIENIPNYLSDLNAMHEAEAKLEHPEAFASRLGPILLRDGSASNQDGTTAWHFAFAHATAAQRAEALLRTIGKWTE